MDAAAGVAAGRAASLAMPPPPLPSSSSSQSARKEWRAVSDHSVRSAGTEEMERTKLGQTDERTIYEQGTGQLDVDFCSITVEGGGGGGLDNGLLQQRLHSVSRQREELQEMEIELRAQVIARSEIVEMQKRFDAQMKEQVEGLKEKVQEREQKVHDLELKMEEKDRELRAIKIDNEAAWAKEDLLREQNKELASFRRERDNSDVERTQHLKQIHELKEHIQEKERQFLELEEQHRAAQETILYKDEQLREVQAWVGMRIQEVEHSKQAEMYEHFQQFWLGCQRQFADVERHHLQNIHQLQLELAEARERNGIYTDESRMTHAESKDASQYSPNKGNQFNLNESTALTGNSEVLPNGNVENGLPFVSAGNASSKAEHAAGVPIVPGLGAYIPPGQMTAMHPFVVHQQGIQHSLQSVNSHVPPSHAGHYQTMPGISSHQQWQNQHAAVSEGSQISSQNQYLPSKSEQGLLSSGAHFEYAISANGHVFHSDYLNPHISPNEQPGSVAIATVPNGEAQVIEQPQPNLLESSSKFHGSLGLEMLERAEETKEQENNINVTSPAQEVQPHVMEQQPLSENSVELLKSHEGTGGSSSDMALSEVSASTGQAYNSQPSGKIPEPALLDERQLLACIVRAIPAGSNGRIRITSTLTNRLGKMLAPLHWHDYKRRYGKLDDFVAGHPELFVVEGDFIRLREGAQEIISATAAMAKVAAAAAASAPYSSLLPSVAVTPMAQNHRLKKVPSVDSKPVKSSAEPAAFASADVGGKPPKLSATQNQQVNGVPYNIIQGFSNVKILSKSRDPLELNGLQSEFRHGNSSVHMTIANGANPDKLGSAVTSQDKPSSNGREGVNFEGVNFGGKQPGRANGSVLTSRR
ncbi:hypothetical protein Scep_025286 [Stephania cephalantha]|uniref:DUF7725 domain-containing protein n=1 Tax=Stephania cephalantha TaxID=152367 RepID=A0AAP0ELB4_9MAGN